MILQVASFKLARQAHLPHGAAAPPLRAHRAGRRPQVIVRFWIVAFIFALLSAHDPEAAMTGAHEDAMDAGGRSASWSSGWRGRGSRRRAFLARPGRAVVATDRKPEASSRPEVLSAAGRAACGSSSAAIAARRSPAPSWSSCRPACPGTCRSSQAARAAGVPVIGELELGVAPHPRAGGGDHRHQGQVHDDRRPRRDAARGGPRRARGRQHRRGRSPGSSRARPTATAFVLEVSSFQLEGDRHASGRASRSS